MAHFSGVGEKPDLAGRTASQLTRRSDLRKAISIVMLPHWPIFRLIGVECHPGLLVISGSSSSCSNSSSSSFKRQGDPSSSVRAPTATCAAMQVVVVFVITGTSGGLGRTWLNRFRLYQLFRTTLSRTPLCNGPPSPPGACWIYFPSGRRLSA